MPMHNCFIDIGANLGIYTVTIAQANPSKKVIAIEPLKKNCEILMENVKLNNLSNCICLSKAVSTQKGPLKFYINPIHDGGGSLQEKDIYQTGNIKLEARKFLAKHPSFIYYQETETITIDDMVTDKTLMKIDVEGSELDVIKSAIQTFKTGLCDVFIVEVQRDNFLNILNFMKDIGFDCYKLDKTMPLDGTERFDRFIFIIIVIRRGTNYINKIVYR